MKKFLAVYTGTPEGMEKWMQINAANRQQKEKKGMQAWGQWLEKNSRSLVDTGAPLGKTKKVDAKGISDIRNQMAAYAIVQAESHEDAAKIFLNHPHFTIFPGDGVEIMECLPIPNR